MTELQGSTTFASTSNSRQNGQWSDLFPTQCDTSQLQKSPVKLSNFSPSPEAQTPQDATISSQSKRTTSPKSKNSSPIEKRLKALQQTEHTELKVDTHYTLEAHFKSPQTAVKIDDAKKKEAQLREEMREYLLNTPLNSQLQQNLQNQQYFSRSQRQKRSVDRKNNFEAALSSIQRTKRVTTIPSQNQTPHGGGGENGRRETLSIMLSREELDLHLSQFSVIRPKQHRVLSEKTQEDWEYKDFYDQFEFGQTSIKRGLQRVRAFSKEGVQTQGSISPFADQKKFRNPSLNLQKQIVASVSKPQHNAPSSKIKILKQFIKHPKSEKILDKFDFSKSTQKPKMKDSPLSINTHQPSDNLGICLLKNQLSQKAKNMKINFLRNQVHSAIQREDEKCNPYKVPIFKESKDPFYEIDVPNLKKAFKKFKDYKPISQDEFYSVKSKNPYFRVYVDGQQKIIDSYLENNRQNQRFFYQYEHDPFINDPVNYKIFEIVGNTFMKTVPQNPISQKRRYAKEQIQLDRELAIAQQTYQTNLQEQGSVISEPASPTSSCKSIANLQLKVQNL